MTRRRKKHCPDEIVAKLRDADALLNAGKDLAAVLQALEVSDSTLERWRAGHRRVCGFRLGQGLGSSRTRWIPWSPLFLNPHIAWYMKSNPVSAI